MRSVVRLLRVVAPLKKKTMMYLSCQPAVFLSVSASPVSTAWSSREVIAAVFNVILLLHSYDIHSTCMVSIAATHKLCWKRCLSLKWPAMWLYAMEAAVLWVILSSISNLTRSVHCRKCANTADCASRWSMAPSTIKHTPSTLVKTWDVHILP